MTRPFPMVQLFTNWGAVRWIRLLIAVAFLMAGVSSGDTVAYAASFFFALQAVLNFGCCGSACSTTRQDDTSATNGTDIVYEEVR